MYTVPVKLNVQTKSLIKAFENGDVKPVEDAEEITSPNKTPHPELYHDELAAPGTARKLLQAFTQQLAQPSSPQHPELYDQELAEPGTARKLLQAFTQQLPQQLNSQHPELYDQELAEPGTARKLRQAFEYKSQQSVPASATSPTGKLSLDRFLSFEQKSPLDKRPLTNGFCHEEKVIEEVKVELIEGHSESRPKKIIEEVKTVDIAVASSESNQQTTDQQIHVEVSITEDNVIQPVEEKLEEKVVEKIIEKVEEKVEEKLTVKVEEKVEELVQEEVLEKIEENSQSEDVVKIEQQIESVKVEINNNVKIDESAQISESCAEILKNSEVKVEVSVVVSSEENVLSGNNEEIHTGEVKVAEIVENIEEKIDENNQEKENVENSESIVNDKIEEKIEKKIEEKIEEKVEQKIEEKIEKKIEEKIEERIEENIEEKVEKIEEKIDEAIVKQIESNPDNTVLDSTEVKIAVTDKSQEIVEVKEVAIVESTEHVSVGSEAETVVSHSKKILYVSAVKGDNEVDSSLRDLTVKILEDSKHNIKISNVFSNQTPDFTLERSNLLESDILLLHYRPILNGPPAVLRSWLEGTLIQTDGTPVDQLLLKDKKAILLVISDVESSTDKENLPFITAIRDSVLRACGFETVECFTLFGDVQRLREEDRAESKSEWITTLLSVVQPKSL